ncbi:hypothetical protein EDC04DRAFT_2601980 [Pisolithus marmoratus]|nr:hypothetical protein EDC04DRAFT_2601980 [Pisolithus marmoratus]
MFQHDVIRRHQGCRLNAVMQKILAEYGNMDIVADDVDELVIWMYVYNCLFIVLGHARAPEDQWLRQCMCNTSDPVAQVTTEQIRSPFELHACTALHDTNMIISPIVKWRGGRVIDIGPIAGIHSLPLTSHYAQSEERLIEKMNLVARAARKDSMPTDTFAREVVVIVNIDQWLMWCHAMQNGVKQGV